MFHVCFIHDLELGALKECETWESAVKESLNMIQKIDPKIDLDEAKQDIILEAGYFDTDWSVVIGTPD